MESRMEMPVAMDAVAIRVMTWNVNGLRALLQRESKKTLKEMLDELDAEIVCFQETKLTRAELDECLARPPGYDAFYSFCRVRSGYSGVVTFCKSDVVPTIAAEEGLCGLFKTEDPVGHLSAEHADLPTSVLNELDSEGRCVITDHHAFVLLNVYCPAVRNSDRLEYKLAFHELLQQRVKALQQGGKRVVVVGDINVAHREIDHCEPDACDDLAFADHPCRQWMDRFVQDSATSASQDDQRLVDSFRRFHPTEPKAYTCWNTVTGARQTNYGTRIDYVLVDPELFDDSATECRILPQQTGSDHCPVICHLVVKLPRQSGDAMTRRTASMCAKYYAEFAGKQQSLRMFLAPRSQRGARTAETSALEVDSSPSPSKLSSDTRRKRTGQQAITAFLAPPTKTTSSPKKQQQQFDPTHAQVLEQERLWQAAKLQHAGRKRKLDADQTQWKQVLTGQPPKTPLCFCRQPTVQRTVLKANENWGRKFYVCTKPAGEKGHPDARCEFFQWADQRSSKLRQTRSDVD